MSGTILVTGATSGFGAATARRFIADGWKVIGTGRRQERLDELAKELGGNFLGTAFDICDEDQTFAALEALPADFKDIDILVNNAGLALGTKPVPNTKLSDWKTMINTNITGLVTITHKLIPQLIERKGMIVNIASMAANWPYPGGNVYGATKAFVRQFSLGLRADLVGTGVRVTSLEPGLCESEFTLVRTGGNQQAYDDLYKGAHAIQPEDIANTIHWLASLPPHLNFNNMEVMPITQAFAPLNVVRDAD